MAKQELKDYKKMKRVKVDPDELIILEAPEGYIVNAESTYGYGLGDVELKIDISKKTT